ncbi:hypothetical protein [Pseudomonas aeruginosa]|uniref:hypothetical protein n=3 Tax=Pseudomonas aeruginosa TaxID=287 RepID=UPI0002F58B94|nr:hypothetical protein [Pseudomonas aeruginosa]ELB6585510.1 hypothetical protein [Pseudomonas aeruginosa]ELK4934280.1 hypothetical protein [Pseudomonas aeruginosa]HBO4428958.1 hypothetical protein [Pseudomonas aeruginosa]HCF5824135.1 hypothetical protein [Pseudomonas aeruginosa]HDY6171134.1 hypothetical protein [Pseudomonas aeruginosa]
MNKANECSCPSGDGSLVHPCPAHPAVEQAGGDERDFQAEGAQEVPSPVSQEYDRHLISLLRKGEALPGHQEEAADEIERLRDWNDHLNNTVLPNILNPTFLMLMKGGERLLDLCTKDGKFIGVSLNDMKDVFDWMVTHARIAPDHAALAQPSPVLPPFAEKVLAKLRRFYDCAEDFESGGVDIGRHWLDLLTQLGLLNRVQRSPALWEISQQGEDLLGMPQPSPAPELPERGTQHRFGTNEQSCRHDFAGVWWNDNGETKTGRECRHCGFFVADVAEQAEAERPEVFGLERYRVEKTGQGFWPYCVRAGDGTRELFVGHLKQCKRVAAQLATAFEDGKFIAQHESIVGGLRAEITQLRQHKNDYMDAGQETYRALQNEIREREAEIARLDGLVSGRTAERDAALARVAELEQKSAGSWTVDTSCGRPILMYEGCSVIEDQTAYEVIRMIKWIGELERQEPVATVAKVPGEDWNSLDFHRDLQDMQPGTKFYAAPVAQAQQLHDLDKQCRDDVARALGLRPNQERGFAWSYLLASIKSCVKASEDSAQAQHSVPGDIMRDAQRYRWLRDQQFYFSFSTENSDAGISSCTAGMSSRFKNLSWVDAAIDSAIAAAPGKEGV